MTPDNPTAIDPLFKVRNSPLQGVEAYRSDLWRKLQSEGYKGYLQGSIGGATLFGSIGLVAGTAAALVAWPFVAGTVGTAIFGLVPFAALTGAHYGKEAFGQVGAIAAVSAAQAEISEKRRSLLDRYFETPSNEEAKEIELQLTEQTKERLPDKLFHWKSGLLGALVMASITTIAVVALATGLGEAATASGLLGEILSFTGPVSVTTGSVAIGLAALAGSVAGLDRGYIRKWFDTQDYLHDEDDIKSRKLQHTKGVERLKEAYRAEGFGQESRTDLKERVLNEQAQRQPIIPPRVVEPTPNTAATPQLASDNGMEQRPKSTLQSGNDNERQLAKLQETAHVVSL